MMDDNEHREDLDKSLAEELISMAQKDQKMRIRSQKPGSGVKFDVEVDKTNTARLKEIVKEFSWPTISRVGEEASSAAWLLIQHSDLDPDFQEACLSEMRKAPEGEVLPANVAYLTDRVAVNKGKPQVYGTQFYRDENGKVASRPVGDIEKIELRRAAMGLEPFWQSVARYKDDYKWPEGYVNPKIGRFSKVL